MTVAGREEEDAYRTRFLGALDAGRFEAIICPPFALSAVSRGGYMAGPALSYAMLYNLLGMPAGVVAATRVRPGEESDRPSSRDVVEQAARDAEAGSTGLPVGVQIVARHGREDVLLAVMAALETHFARCPDYPASPPRGAEGRRVLRLSVRSWSDDCELCFRVVTRHLVRTYRTSSLFQ
jgi:fatty acid amide hydrolase